MKLGRQLEDRSDQERAAVLRSASKSELAEIAAIADEIDLPGGQDADQGGRHRPRVLRADRRHRRRARSGGKKIAEIGPGRLLRRDRADLEDAAQRDGHDHLAGARARDHRPRLPPAARPLAEDRRSTVLTALAERLAPTSLYARLHFDDGGRRARIAILGAGQIGEALISRAALLRLAHGRRALGLDAARGARRRAARAARHRTSRSRTPRPWPARRSS